MVTVPTSLVPRPHGGPGNEARCPPNPVSTCSFSCAMDAIFWLHGMMAGASVHESLVSLQGIPASVDGMLGGFSRLSGTDIASSKKFLQPFLQASLSPSY